MKKHIALGIAAAVLGATGVASAVASYDNVTSAAGSESSFETTTDHLAANCWVVTGGGQDAGCTTSVAGVDLPAVPDLPALPGVEDVSGLADRAQGVAGEALSNVPDPAALVSQAKSLAGEFVPSACNLPVALPAQLPVPRSIFSAGLEIFHKVQARAMNNPATQALPPVNLPVEGVPSADDVINLTQGQLDCLAEHFGGSLPVNIPVACSVDAPGVPSSAAGAVPGEISGLLATAVAELQNLTGQGINIAGNNIGVNCPIPAEVTERADSVVGTVTNAVPSPSSVTDQAGSVAGTAGSIAGDAAGTAGDAAGTATGTVTDAVGTVTGLTGTVTGTVDGALDTVDGVVNGLVPTSGPECEASANASGGLLGSLAATITGGCK